MVLGMVALYFYLSRQQTYTVTMDIQYLNDGASDGLTPMGGKLDPEEIRSAIIVNSALENIGLDCNVDYIRDSLTVQSILTNDEEDRKKAILEKGEEYNITPTNYRVQLTLDSSYSVETAQNIMTAIVNQYMIWYGNQYVISRTKPGALDKALLDKFDYIVALDQISDEIDNILNYIYNCGETFRSSQTGLSFYDLQTQLELLRNTRLEDVYVKTLKAGITQDPELLRDYYNSDIAEKNLMREKLLREAKEMKKLLDVYEQRMLEAQSSSSQHDNSDDTEETEVGESSPIILNHVYEIYDNNENPVYSQNSYEKLMDTYADYYSKIYAMDKTITRDKFILTYFSGVSAASDANSQEDIHEEILWLIDRVNSIYEQVNIVGTEYNQSEIANNIRVKSSAISTKGVNIELYMFLGAILFLGLGCVGAIVLGRAGDLMDFVLYTDKITGLPSRLSCDEKIEQIAKAGALSTFSCVCLSVTNLGDINTRYGREVGNQMLADLGQILEVTAKQYGFIGYNNSNQFLCLLDHCPYEKAKDMLDFIGNELALAKYHFKPSVSAKIGTSDRLACYQINNLISHTFKQEEIIVYKAKNNDKSRGTM